MTIEERAKEFAKDYTIDAIAREKSYIQGATDQDPISRADERKKVIEDMRWFLMDNCMGTVFSAYDLGRLIKAMEE